MAFLLLLLALWYWNHKMRYRTGLYVICFYLFSSMMSILFYFQPLANLNGQISFWPFFYWFLVFVLTLLPLYQFDTSKIRVFKYNLSKLNNIIKWGALLSIFPLIEQIAYIPSLVFGHGVDLGESLVDMHNDGGVLNQLSFIGRNLLRVNIAIYDLAYIVLFVNLLQDKVDRKTIMSVLIILLTRNLTGILQGHRSSLIDVGIRTILIIVLLYPSINKEKKRLLNKIGFCIFGFAGVIFGVITIGRQMYYSVMYGEDFTMIYFLSRYAGEGLVNFNQFLPLMKNTIGGGLTCWPIVEFLGLNPPDIYNNFWNQIEKIQGIPQNIFYTYIGSFVQDFGFLMTPFVLVIPVLIVKNVTYVRSRVMPVSKLYIYVMYVSSLLNGVTSFSYCGENMKFLLWSIIIYIYLRISRM